jgi:hypothetical protein
MCTEIVAEEQGTKPFRYVHIALNPTILKWILEEISCERLAYIKLAQSSFCRQRFVVT